MVSASTYEKKRSRDPASENVRIGASEIHGRGIFARHRIEKGQLIGAFEGVPSTDENHAHLLWVAEEDGSFWSLRVTNKLKYINHSPRPNAEIQWVELYALRTIQVGDEITHHYGTEWEEEVRPDALGLQSREPR